MSKGHRRTTVGFVGTTVACLLLLVSATVSAQDTVLVGTIADTTGGVLPGVTVTALLVATGNTFVGFTGIEGNYRLAVRAGIYTITAELPGFSSVEQPGIEIGVGQQVTLDFDMAVGEVEETVTVTGASPIVDLVSSEVGGRIDRRMVEDLPVNGRQFINLTMLAVGSRSNSLTESATEVNVLGAESQINLDGQQITQTTCCQDSFGNPKVSKDSIAEFEVVTTRFDATQGHSMGTQVNAITKSGTNLFSGSFGSYFRDDSMNAEDFIANRVLPYSNTQLSGTIGGPLVQDRLHFFFNYERETQPQTFIHTTGVPLFDQDTIQNDQSLYTTGLKVDWQVNPQNHASVRGYKFTRELPAWQAGGSARTLSNANTSKKKADSIYGTLTSVFGSSMVNELKGGYASYFSFTGPFVERQKYIDSYTYRGPPYITLANGLRFGGPSNTPQRWIDENFTVRDDLTMLFSRGGRHEVKVGGEYMAQSIDLVWMHYFRGYLRADAGAVPSNAELEAIFPSMTDWTTWNINALSPITRDWQEAIGSCPEGVEERGCGPFIFGPRKLYSIWLQDNWSISDNLTLNLGMRYEYSPEGLNEDLIFEPFLPTERISKKDEFQPRVGFNYAFNDGRTSIRGGAGRYIGMHDLRTHWGPDLSAQTVNPQQLNDGRADFATNPYGGNRPSFAEALALAGSTTWAIQHPDMELAYSWQTSLGFQHQLDDYTGIEADWVFQGNRNVFDNRNMNLTYGSDGVPLNFRDPANRPFPDWGVVQLEYTDRYQNYNGLQMALNRRFSNRWQGTVTYLFSGFRDIDSPCGQEGLGRLITSCPPDVGGDYTLAVNDQRHRITANGIWEGPLGVQVSGLYFFGSGLRASTTWGGDPRGCFGGCESRLGPDGIVYPRNDFVGLPLHRVDMRVMKRFGIGDRFQVDGIFEMFNVFNHENFGSYQRNRRSSIFGNPVQNLAVEYQPRILQLGVRIAY